MAHRVCPWWIGYLLLIPLRRLWQDPGTIVSPYVTEGMTVLEPGPGMGFFTLELARLVGHTGKVVAVDLQPRMLRALRKRAARASLGGRIETRLATSASLGVDDLAGKIGFVLAFALVHELPDASRFLAETARALMPGGRLLLAEPSGHVPEEEFQKTMDAAAAAGFRVSQRPVIRSSHAALLVRA